MKIKISTIILSLLILMSFLIGFIYNEDSLGGAKNDYLYHLDYFYKFHEEFFNTFKNYGLDQQNNSVRNSPVFYILGSLLFEFRLPIISLKFINLGVTLLSCLIFYKCLVIKYGENNKNAYYLISLLILLSPSIRSLTFWPYPLLWAIYFFLISIFYYLKFEKNKDHSLKFNYALLNTIFLALSAYLTPNFAVFSIYFFINFYKYFKDKYPTIIILLLNLLIALPAVLFLISHDFYLFKSEVFEIGNLQKYNISNKIIIITSFLILFFMPFANFKNLVELFYFKINQKFYLIVLFLLVNIYFFNFQSGAGGGIFFHISNIFETNLIIFSIFVLSICLFHSHNLINTNNILLFLLLIIYNPQFTIYYKYFDPLMIFIFLFLFQNIRFNFETMKVKLLIFYVLFLNLNLFKGLINY